MNANSNVALSPKPSKSALTPDSSDTVKTAIRKRGTREKEKRKHIYKRHLNSSWQIIFQVCFGEVVIEQKLHIVLTIRIFVENCVVGQEEGGERAEL